MTPADVGFHDQLHVEARGQPTRSDPNNPRPLPLTQFLNICLDPVTLQLKLAWADGVRESIRVTNHALMHRKKCIPLNYPN